MKIGVYAVGNKMPSWVQEAWHEYAKRMPKECSLNLHEIKPEARSGGKSTQQVMQAEASRIKHAVPDKNYLIILDEHGKDLSTMSLSKSLKKWLSLGSDIAIVIGGADGLDQELKASANETIRLSSLTLPHPMVRIILAEQIYRAWSILHGHPYHRA